LNGKLGEPARLGQCELCKLKRDFGGVLPILYVFAPGLSAGRLREIILDGLICDEACILVGHT
jgi:hypothetical protein